MRTKNALWILVIVVFIGLFAYRTAYQSADFFSYTEDMHWDLDAWYVAGEMWRAGENPYLPAEFGQRLAELRGYQDGGENLSFNYPPPLMLFFMGLSLLPIQAASWLLFGLNLLLIFVMLYLVSRIIVLYRPVGLPEIAFLAAMLSTGIRTNLKYHQLGLIIGCAVLGTILLVLRKRDTAAGLTAGAAVFKPTSAPILMVYFLLKKNFRLVLAAIGMNVIFWLLPFLFTSLQIIPTVLDFATTLGGQAVGIDDPSPFVAFSATQYQLQVLLLRALNSDAQWAHLTAWVLVIGLTILVFWLVLKRKTTWFPELFDLAVLSVWTMLGIYHRSYEVYLLIPGLVVLYLVAQQLEKPRSRMQAMTFTWGLLLADALPSDISIRLIERVPALADVYLFRLAAPIKVWLSLAVLVSLLVIKYWGKKIGTAQSLSPANRYPEN